MTTEKDLEEIYQAKLTGSSDEEIMKRFSVGLREIENAVLRKTGVNLNLFKESPKVTRLAPTKFQLEQSTVWSFKSRGKWATHNGNYRGNWSPYIPRNVILRYTQPGDIILDQFCGGGTTAVEAKLLGRRCIARDINPASVKLTKHNLDFAISKQETLVDNNGPSEYFDPIVEVGDARQLQDIENESIDLVCTHPPYANIVQYTEDLEDDISHHDVDEFIQDMRSVAKECYRVLKPDGVCAILIGDTRRNKRVVPIGFRTIEEFLSQDFSLKDLIIKRQHNCRTTGFWYSSSVKHNFLLLAQEYLPVFVKTKSEKPKSIKRNNLFFDHEQMMVPPAPSKMECKTTWVLPSQNLGEIRDANILNRYSKNGKVLRAVLGKDNGDRLNLEQDYYDLVYVDYKNENFLADVSVDEFSFIIHNHIESLSSLVTSDGHLVIRAMDNKMNGQTKSPILKIWDIPENLFKIREIVVVTSEEIHHFEKSPDTLEINHEYLLVYQKS